MRQIEQIKPAGEGSVQMRELLDICETEGNAQNGGGAFSIQDDPPRGLFVKFTPDGASGNHRAPGGPGEIGSPIVGSAMPFGGSGTGGMGGGGRGFQPPGGAIPAPSF